ncbi:unnamed protein product [Cylicocyclus nassatus]|uniref:Uncharacterized protein n=1 Tax=Cylicocyclus nassatus TaxID=53992 RepID=A0AA36GCC0_CYLNA|nr:unnamed protein product [Cylicocyclus nassatus]
MDDTVIDVHDSDGTGSSSSRPWIKNTSNFPSSVLSLVTLAILVYLVNCLVHVSTFTCGLLAVAMGLLVHHWYWLHGVKLTRKERLFFDEANLLETSNLFEYTYGPCTEGTTPISGPEKNPDAPTTLWQALFCDDKQLQMQKFYKEHYGPVWETAKRREQEWKAIEKNYSSRKETNGKNVNSSN